MSSLADQLTDDLVARAFGPHPVPQSDEDVVAMVNKDFPPQVAAQIIAMYADARVEYGEENCGKALILVLMCLVDGPGTLKVLRFFLALSELEYLFNENAPESEM